MTKPAKRALIIGGGIGGPILALFLKKIGIEAAIYEASPGPASLGVGLHIAPNGMNVLSAIGIAGQLRGESIEVNQFRFENQLGKLLATMPAPDAVKFGQPSIMIARSALHDVLLSSLQNNGIKVNYSSRLLRIVDTPGVPVTAIFEDGSTAEGDFLVGADGIRSQVRSAAIPDAPKPSYTGLMAPGAFSPCIGDSSFGPRAKQFTHLIFGANGFFGYSDVITPQGPRTMWWSTSSAPLPSREEMAATTQGDLRRKLLDLHRGWAEPVPQLIRTAEDIANIAIHDVPNLPRWSAGRVVLIGDAAHAVAPHSGQGASMACEDAMLLAKLLRDDSGGDLQKIFASFEHTRRPRTTRVIAYGRRSGQRKEKMSALAFWIQQQMIRLFIPLSGTKEQDWQMGYKIDW